MNVERLASLDRTLRRWLATAVYELRRTRRVIVAPESRIACSSPIFVLGVHRSGTTLLRLILDTHSRIACPPESFFLGALEGLLSDPKSREGLMAMGFDEAHVLGRLRELSGYFFETYAASHGKPRWADKTPAYIDHLGFIESLFAPGCRYLLILRHGLDVAASIARMEIREVVPHIEACGGDRHAGAARYWSTQCAKLLAFRDAHPDRCHVIRYEALVEDPEPTLRPIFRFLSEPWEPEVLRFHEKPHDHWIGLQDGEAAESRGFLRRSERWRSLPAERVEAMLRECGAMLDALGYAAPERAGR